MTASRQQGHRDGSHVATPRSRGRHTDECEYDHDDVRKRYARENHGSDRREHNTREHAKQITESFEAVKERAQEKSHEEVEVRGRTLEKGDIFKFAGLIAFFLLSVLICVLIWPYVHELFEPGGVDRVIADVRDAGPVGFLILLGLQFLQVVVAFIPGEVVQIAAGLLYGPWIGALIILLGCVVSSAFIFVVVRKLGAPFVQSMVSTQHLDKFRAFEETGKLNAVVFVLFLIPGLPKDVFTYLVPLTDINMRLFLVLSNVARIPGIVVSTYAADGLVDGRFVESIVIFVIAAVIAVLGIAFRERIMKVVGGHSRNRSRKKDD